MSSQEVPEPWASRMVECGFTDPRYLDDRPSMTRLGERIGIHTTTISSAIHGRRRASAATVSALVEALGPDVAGWLGAGQAAAWTPPAEAALLTDRQRKAVEELIRAMAEQRQESDHDRAPSITDAGATPAHPMALAADDEQQRGTPDPFPQDDGGA